MRWRWISLALPTGLQAPALGGLVFVRTHLGSGVDVIHGAKDCVVLEEQGGASDIYLYIYIYIYFLYILYIFLSFFLFFLFFTKPCTMALFLLSTFSPQYHNKHFTEKEMFSFTEKCCLDVYVISKTPLSLILQNI